MNLLVADIDHTISAASWRDWMIENNDWDAYHAEAMHDKPIPEMVALVNTLSNSGWSVIGLTARPEKWRMMTNSWLMHRDVRIDTLLMRPDDNFLPSPALKIDLLKSLLLVLSPVAEHIIVLDDREDVAMAMKAEGYTVLQVFARAVR